MLLLSIPFLHQVHPDIYLFPYTPPKNIYICTSMMCKALNDNIYNMAFNIFLRSYFLSFPYCFYSYWVSSLGYFSLSQIYHKLSLPHIFAPIAFYASIHPILLCPTQLSLLWSCSNFLGRKTYYSHITAPCLFFYIFDLY